MGNPYLAARAAEVNCGESSEGAVGMTVAVGGGLAINGGSRIASGGRPPQQASNDARSARVTALHSVVQFGINVLLGARASVIRPSARCLSEARVLILFLLSS